MASFLRDKHYLVQVGSKLGPKTPNNIAVPHWSVLFPTLFNIAIANLSPLLRKIDDLGFTIYENNVRLETKGSLGKEESTLQDGINAVPDFIRSTGLSLSP